MYNIFPDVVLYTEFLALEGLRLEDQEFKASLCYTVSSITIQTLSLQRKQKTKHQYKTEMGMMTHTFNPSTQEAAADRSLHSRPAWAT